MSAQRVYRIFVGNLPWTISKHELSQYFGKFGNVRSATVTFNNKTGLSKGYGFVVFSNKDGYTAALSQDNHLLENNKLSVAIRQVGVKELETGDSE